MSVAADTAVSWRDLWSGSSRSECSSSAALLVAVVATSLYLLPFWRDAGELSHGYFAPFCSLVLLWQSRQEPDLLPRLPPVVRAGWAWLLFVAGVSIGCVTAMAALAQGPFHPQTAFLAGLTVTILLLSGTTALARAEHAWVRFNGASLCAAALWCFVVPLPSGTLARFTLFLREMITSGSVRTLHLFGLAAIRQGNIIHLANGLVGVEEACSGIRSLTACLFAGVVLGGFMLRGIWLRVALVVASVVVAIAANLVRSVSLCLMAAHDVDIKGFWHDTTAYVVLGATALVLFAGCLLLGRGRAAPQSPASTAPAARLPLVPYALLFGSLALLALLVAVKIVPSPANERPPPDLTALMVIDEPGWQRHVDSSVFAFGPELNTSWLRQETYRRGDLELTLFVAFWPSQQSTLGSVTLHTPDICLPGSGWSPLAPPPPIARYPLPSPLRVSFTGDGAPLHVWFWHFYNGERIGPVGLHPWQLAPLLLRRGISAHAPQWVIRISSNQPLESLLDEPILREFFARVRAAGLAGASSAN
ncbi:MAG TPA: exosortase/archaeosortase family protein [Opitutaceae bacterium]|nr:exosortase/archaeosortase family protein [Opitutaceae bacterium]